MILSAGCQPETDFSEAVTESQAVDLDSFKVSESLAKDIALSFFNTDSSFTAARARTNRRSPKIREIARVSLADSLDFEAYVINDMEGFVMVSGDSRIMPILAYSSEGKLSPEDFQEVNGLKVWYRETMAQIERELKEIMTVHPIVYNEWKKYSEDYDPNGRFWDSEVANYPNTNCYEWYQYGQHMCNPYMSVYQRKPLYSYHATDNPTGIKWGQTGISNHMAPTNIFNDCSCNDRSPIGCGAVAIAQTLWYYRPTSSYSYALMPQTSNACQTPSTSGQTSLALLMYNSAQAANTNFNFGTTCNGMTLPGNISPALQSMGMQNGGSTSNFNPWLLSNELYQGYPAIFYGQDGLFEWHIWTSDGFKTHNYKSYDCDRDGCMEWSYTWYFMNWGWNDNDLNSNDGVYLSSNGFYSASVYTPYGSTSNYNNGLKMITGIR